MSRRVGLVRAPGVAAYDHGPQHPLRPERVLLTWDLIEATGVQDRDGVSVLGAEPAPHELIARVHTDAFIDATTRSGHGEEGAWARFGYGPGDNPIFPDMHEAAALVCGASVRAADAVWSGEHDHAFNAAGGLHHAMPERASGFCVYDDPAVAIARLLDRGATRVAYVDVDVHHGDGPQAIFWDDPRVLTISIHEYGALFPGTGGASERGGASAPGSAINIPLPAGTGDAGWLAAFHAVVPDALAAFEPEIIVTQLGSDTHHSDPLANLELTTAAYREAARTVHVLAHDLTDGRWIATGGGGYQWARVVPRAWTLWFAEMAGAADDLADELPPDWVRRAQERWDGPVPATFADPPLGPSRADEEAARIGRAVSDILGG
ncbi:MAG TPA: acetoin utilization protein AcuC [Actinomycetota bacterium]|nr:acetoin utilization protein AcuC [Actinomycetota bacterium]